MKRIYLLLPLVCAALLISGCPDAKLPTPTPTVPTPKTQETTGHGLQETVAGHRPLAQIPDTTSLS